MFMGLELPPRKFSGRSLSSTLVLLPLIVGVSLFTTEASPVTTT